MQPAAGLRSLALAFPRTTRTNDYWRTHHPEMLEAAGDKPLAKVWSLPPDQPVAEAIFASEMSRYLDDPFRGAVSRRILDPGETPLSLELEAARKAIAAAGMTVGDIDLAIVSSFLPDGIGIGNAAFVAKALELQCPAWNIESACSAALVALEIATSFVRTGAYRAILVVVSCTYSRVAPETDTLAWANGDGATAFIVGPVAEGTGVLAIKTVNTADGCGAMYYEIDGSQGAPQIRMRSGENAGSTLRRTSERGVRECCLGAAALAGVGLDDIDFFVMPTPTAWYAAFCAKALGFPRERTLNTHPVFANTGPVLMPTNLFYAAWTKRIEPGSLVMLHTVGIVSTASAAVVRWGDVGLGTSPAPLIFDPVTGDASEPGG